MATTNKDFRVKNGLVVEGTTSTVNGNQVLTIASSIDALSDVVISTPTSNQVLLYNGTNWVNSSSGGGGTTTNALTIGTGLSGTSFDGSAAVTIANTGVLSVNGSAGVISGIATTAGNLSQFAATTSAQLAGVVSDETGSGALVFATSPTLVTPNIGVATGTSFNSITGLSSTTPSANGTAAVGTATTAARADHVHQTPTSVVATVSGTNSADLVYGNMADNDQFRIRVGGTASNAGFVEIATADDGTEPIYVRQYTGVFTTLARTATLLDGSGNTTFPGTVSATSFNSITGLSATTPIANGTAAVGTATTTARADHVHPTTGLGLTASGLNQFAATTSAQLAGVISDETGSGALVFATSPTLTTPNIGVATGTSFNSITGLSSTNPAALGTVAIGTGTTTARADHVHPTTGLGLTASGLNQFAATTSAQLAGVISDETGSGALVFGTGPTMTLPVINNYKTGYTTTATAAGTTTLTSASNKIQFFTGTTTQIVVLPVTSTLATGVQYEIHNNSTGTVTVQSSGLNTVIAITAGLSYLITCVGTALTTAADWDADFMGATSITGTGSVVLSTSPTFTGTVNAAAITTTGTVAINTAGTGTINLGDGTLSKTSGTGFQFNSGAVFTSTISASGLAGSLLSSTVGAALGTAAAGTATIPARADHVHANTSVGAMTGTSFNSITGLSSTNPAALGTVAVGTGTTTARADHVHPTTGLGLTASGLNQFAATTSAQLAGVISDETGSGALVFATSPTLVTPSIGVATGTSFNSITGLSSTNPAALGTVAIGTGTTTARADHVHPTTGLGLTASGLNQFAATTSAQLAGVISDETGSGALVFGTSPTIGTPSISSPTVTGTLTAGGTTGTSGQLLESTGSGIQWKTVSAPSSGDQFLLMGG